MTCFGSSAPGDERSNHVGLRGADPAIDDWWRANRPKAPDLFLDELADTLALIEASSALGRPWTATEVPGVRRVVMRATRYHV